MARRNSNSLPVLIAGGGIAGLSAAIALARAGHDVRLFERERKLTTAGAGIQLGPNATRRLQALGVWKHLEKSAVTPEAIHIGDGLTGAALARTPLGDAALARYGSPYVMMHRAALQAGLLKAARALKRIEINLGAGITAFDQTPQAIFAIPAKGRPVTGKALIAADGLWSALRPCIAPECVPVFSGRTAWRALIPAGDLPEEWRRRTVHLWLAPDAHLVHYPVNGGRSVNVVAVIEDAHAESGWNLPGDSAHLLAAFGRWSPRLRDGLLAAAHGWRRWSLFRMATPPRWTQGRAVLAGDAAHPVLPFLAQGAALAIEDADALAQVLGSRVPRSGSTDIPAALARYQGLRAARASRVQAASARMGRIYHFGGAARAARNLALRTARPQRLLARFDWLYRG